MERGKTSTDASAPSSSSSASVLRKDNIARLMHNADVSLNMLASLEGLSDLQSPPTSTLTDSTVIMGDGEDEPYFPSMNRAPNSIISATSSIQSVDFISSGRHPANLRASVAPDHSNVDLSVRQPGFLHVKGVFPDQSVEFVDVDPRFTTVQEIKQLFCQKRQPQRDLGFDARHARVMFDGQVVEDDWLIMDCGMCFEGTLYIVKCLRATRASNDAGHHDSSVHSPRRLSTGSRKSMTGFDGNLSISSISSVYQHQREPQLLEEELENFQERLVLSSSSSSVGGGGAAAGAAAKGTNGIRDFQAQQLGANVRPEEKAFAQVLADFVEHFDRVQDTDTFCERLITEYIDVLQTRLEKLESLQKVSAAQQHPYGSGPGSGFGPVAGSSANAAVNNPRFAEDIKQLRDERNTWRLLYELRQICRHRNNPDDDEPMSMDELSVLRFDMTEDEAIRVLEQSNASFKIHQAVKKWLETIAMEQICVMSDKRVGFSRTLKYAKRNPSSRPNLRLDPDASLREGDQLIAEDDVEDEVELLKSLWLLIRAGKTQDAIELCIRLGQTWRAASISGGQPIGVCDNERGGLERWGNPFRAVWKSMCWRFAEADVKTLTKRNSHLARQFEEIVYAALCGNVQSITRSPHCENWEDHCWAFFNGLLEQQKDELLLKLFRLKLQSSQLIVGNDPHHMRVFVDLLNKSNHLKPFHHDLNRLFDELKTSPVEIVRIQAQEPHRQIQAKLVTANTDEIVLNILDPMIFHANDEFYDWNLQLDQECVKSDELAPQFLRFAAHFVLFLRATGEQFDEKAGHMILKAYIRHLIKHAQYSLVPIYISQFPEEACVELYYQYLRQVHNYSDRERCVKLILDYSKNRTLLEKVVYVTTSRMLDELHQQKMAELTANDTTTSRLVTAGSPTAIDRERMRSLEFLCFLPNHRSEALYQANRLARQFVHEQNLEAVKLLFEKHLPRDSLGVIDLHRGEQGRSDDLERSVRELLCWQALLRAMDNYELWRLCLGNFIAMPSNGYSEEKEFVAELMYHVSRATTMLIDVLHFEHGWLRGCSTNPQQEQAFDEDEIIRGLCLPTLVFQLHNVQLQSAKAVLRLASFPEQAKYQIAQPLVEKSLQVADIVADEEYGVYQSLRADQCADLLERLRQSAISMVFLEEKDTMDLH